MSATHMTLKISKENCALETMMSFPISVGRAFSRKINFLQVAHQTLTKWLLCQIRKIKTVGTW